MQSYCWSWKSSAVPPWGTFAANYPPKTSMLLSPSPPTKISLISSRNTTAFRRSRSEPSSRRPRRRDLRTTHPFLRRNQLRSLPPQPHHRRHLRRIAALPAELAQVTELRRRWSTVASIRCRRRRLTGSQWRNRNPPGEIFLYRVTVTTGAVARFTWSTTGTTGNSVTVSFRENIEWDGLR